MPRSTGRLRSSCMACCPRGMTQSVCSPKSSSSFTTSDMAQPPAKQHCNKATEHWQCAASVTLDLYLHRGGRRDCCGWHWRRWTIQAQAERRITCPEEIDGVGREEYNYGNGNQRNHT